MDKKIFEYLLHRPPDSHKYNYGHVLIIGGSSGMVGAPLLAAKAALRVGAGLATIASNPEVTDKLERRVEEIMTLRLPKSNRAAYRTLHSFMSQRKVSVLVIGPGLKPTTGYGRLLKKIIQTQALPIIIDGGGLGLLSTQLSLLKNHTQTIILTPHIGEFGHLVKEQLPDKRSELKPVAQRFAEAYRVNLVLKGHPTYVVQPDGNLHKNTTGNPGMATAGTGDVLSGVIAGLIAQGIEPEEATEAAVYLHGLAGDMAAQAKTEAGLIASDVIEALPEALKASQHI